MSLWKIAWRSIQQRGLASSLTGLSMALGVMLVVAVLVVHGVIADSFQRNSSLGYNVIVGAKGGKLQLVLNTMFYLSAPIENIPYTYYKRFSEGDYKEWVDVAVPVCLGDYYGNFRVVGTTPAMFDDLWYGNNQKYEFAEGHNFASDDFTGAVAGAAVARETGLKVGSQFHPEHGEPGGHKHDPFTIRGVLKPTGTPNDRAVFVNMTGFLLIPDHLPEEAQQDRGKAAKHAADGEGHEDHEHADDEHADEDHGDEEHGDDEHPDKKHADRKLAGEEHEHEHPDDEHADGEHEHANERLDHADDEHAEDDHEHKDADHAAADHLDEEHHDADHAGEHAHTHADGDHDDAHHHHHDPLPEHLRSMTAFLVRMPDLNALSIVRSVNKSNVAQAVMPIREVTNLFDIFVNPIERVLLGLAILIVIVSGISIMVSIYNSMSERRHEIAIMRALGAGRSTVMLIVLLESVLLALGGGLAGWLLGHAGIAALSPAIAERTGVVLGFAHFVPLELRIIPGLILLAAVAGFLPALVAYRTDVAKTLSSSP